jgi:hypothetical protein
MIILKCIEGGDIDSTDAFRLAQFKTNKTCPVLVKLRSKWDRRFILETSRKQRHYLERLFAANDEPMEIRGMHIPRRAGREDGDRSRRYVVHRGYCNVFNERWLSLVLFYWQYRSAFCFYKILDGSACRT